MDLTNVLKCAMKTQARQLLSAKHCVVHGGAGVVGREKAGKEAETCFIKLT